MAEEDPPGLAAWLALNWAELSPEVAARLLDHYESSARLLAEPEESLARTCRLSSSALERLRAARARNFEAELATLARLGISLITRTGGDYPANLRHIPDPPIALFVRGRLQPQDERAVAIVGTRSSSPYGRLVAESLARDLAARGITVVSGLAPGIDAAAHRGALAAGGRTIAVLGCGMDIPYPQENIEIREQIVAQGAVVTEVPLGAPPVGWRFPVRNRIISGLSLGVVVVEAPEKSGALITARLAGEQGREVFAVPGSVSGPHSRGCHALIRDGAKLVESVDDILEELTIEAGPPEPTPEQPRPNLSPEEDQLLRLLSLQQKHVDALIEESALPASQVSACLLMLELKGLVRRLPGNLFLRVR